MTRQAQISQIQAAIAAHSELIKTGHVLCIDPSVGSSSSLPGFAVYKKGKLVESGLIQVDLGKPLNKRLFEIRRTLQEDFEVPDILILEYIGGYAFGPMRYNITAYHSLIKAVGTVLASFNVDTVIEVPPAVWKKYVDDQYVKGDEADAVYIGRYVINSARGTLPPPREFEKKPRRSRKPRVVKTTTKKKARTKKGKSRGY